MDINIFAFLIFGLGIFVTLLNSSIRLIYQATDDKIYEKYFIWKNQFSMEFPEM